MKMDISHIILTGATLIITGMGGWVLSTVDELESEVSLLRYEVTEMQKDVDVMKAGLYLTDPNHNESTCPICLHHKVGY